MRSRTAVPLFVAATLAAIGAHADACDDDYVAAQKAEKSGALLSARDHYKACATGACPGSEQKDCTLGFASVSPRVPSIVVTVSFGAAPVSAVTVTMDGKPIAFDGKAVDVDPGKHAFHFALDDGRTKDLEVIVIEGTRGQPVKAEFEAKPATDTTPTTTTVTGDTSTSTSPPLATDTTPSTSSGGGWSSQKYLALGLMGIGVVGVVVGAIEGAHAKSAWNDSKAECASPTDCPSHDAAVTDHDSAKSAATISTVSFVVGGAALVGGALWFFLGSSGSQEKAADTGSLHFSPAVYPGGMSAAFTGSF
jgi:hypothetical protein